MGLSLNGFKATNVNGGSMSESVSIPKSRFEELKRKATAFDRLMKKKSGHIMLSSENSLAKDWLSKEEEEAWKGL